MAKLLIVVDMQKDFIDGALGTKEAVAIVPNVVQKIKEYVQQGDKIIFTKDTHFDGYLDTQEGRNLPVEHCIKGTPGHEICNEIKQIVDLDDYKVYEKLTFGSSELAGDLAAGMYSDAEEITLVGLCTDICVISNAMLCKTFLTETPVCVAADCCAGVTPESHNNALKAMEMCQIKIV
ncbi:MAG: cysteine hydrolase [Lachnospiraceae bacterium]|nr:cysteine hydrolase [Lachnospiraceae bacterium]